jgi:hypothetical protein
VININKWFVLILNRKRIILWAIMLSFMLHIYIVAWYLQGHYIWINMRISHISIFIWTVHCFLFHFNLFEYGKALLQGSFNHILAVMVLKLICFSWFTLFVIWSDLLIKLNILSVLILRFFDLLDAKIFFCVYLNLKWVNILIFIINRKLNMNSILLRIISYVEGWFFIHGLCVNAWLPALSVFIFIFQITLLTLIVLINNNQPYFLIIYHLIFVFLHF